MQIRLNLFAKAVLPCLLACTFAFPTLFAQEQNQDQTQNNDGSLHRRSHERNGHDEAQPSPTPASSPQPSTLPVDVSGMYAFLKEGEYLQLSIGNGEVEGVISIYGESKSDKGEFEDLLFDTTRVSGDTLQFTTKHVHGTWFEFNGTIVRGNGKKRDDEGYYLMKGTLIRNTPGTDGKVQSMQREVSLRSLPESFGRE